MIPTITLESKPGFATTYLSQHAYEAISDQLAAVEQLADDVSLPPLEDAKVEIKVTWPEEGDSDETR